MSLRKRLWETTVSGAVPSVVNPIGIIRKVRPNLLVINNGLRKKKKRLISIFQVFQPTDAVSDLVSHFFCR